MKNQNHKPEVNAVHVVESGSPSGEKPLSEYFYPNRVYAREKVDVVIKGKLKQAVIRLNERVEETNAGSKQIDKYDVWKIVSEEFGFQEEDLK